MTDSPAASMMGLMGNAASISVGLAASGLVFRQVNQLNRTSCKCSSKKKRKRK